MGEVTESTLYPIHHKLIGSLQATSCIIYPTYTIYMVDIYILKSLNLYLYFHSFQWYQMKMKVYLVQLILVWR